jgi:hypothetical protein
MLAGYDWEVDPGGVTIAMMAVESRDAIRRRPDKEV